MYDRDRMLRNIEKLGERYCTENLGKWNKQRLESDWWEALKFFFGHSFFRGRRDKLSNEYYYFTINALTEHFQITPENLDDSYQRVKRGKELFDSETVQRCKDRYRKGGGKGSFTKDSNLKREMTSNNKFLQCLTSPKTAEVEWENKRYPVERKLDNEEDIMMVLDTLKLISDENKMNIYKYLKQAIQSSKIKAIYGELTEMRAIGDKIATLIIRDIELLNPKIISPQECEYIFPVDVWVREVFRRLSPGSSKMKDNDIKQTFIKLCDASHIYPAKFAAGLWYLGSNSLHLALEYLDEVEIDAQR